MGYRSDVGIVLKQKVVGAFYDIPLQMEDENKHFFSDLLSRTIDTSVAPNGDMLFVWREIKWYENDNWFPEINAIMSFLDALELDDYFYCCIGESLEDNEEKGFYYDNPFGLSINRHLDYFCRD